MAERSGFSQKLSSNSTYIVDAELPNSLSRDSGFYYLKCHQAVHHALVSVHEPTCAFYSLSPYLYGGKDFFCFLDLV